MFKKYCRVCYNIKDEFPLQKDLFEQVRVLTGWKEEEVRQNSNRIGFRDVWLNEEQIEASIQEAENSAKDMENTVFEAYLYRFSELLAQPKMVKPKVWIARRDI